jgi:hypothetical protein
MNEIVEMGWLVEREGPSWASIGEGYIRFQWTTDSTKALRFSRKEDADRARLLMQGSEKLVAKEHVWIGGVPRNELVTAQHDKLAQASVAEQTTPQVLELVEQLCDCEGPRLNGRARELANALREALKSGAGR